MKPNIMRNLFGKVVIVMDTASGLGAATAERLANDGFKVNESDIQKLPLL